MKERRFRRKRAGEGKEDKGNSTEDSNLSQHKAPGPIQELDRFSTVAGVSTMLS